MSFSASFRRRLRPVRLGAGRILTFLLNISLYPLSGLFPRSPYRWTFGYTGNLFADNPKYLYLWMLLHQPQIEVTWITGSRETRDILRQSGLPVHLRWSLRGVMAVLRSQVVVFSHGMSNVNTFLSRQAFLVNLWHGVGIKSVHLGHKGGHTAAAQRISRTIIGRIMGLEYLRPYDVVVTTSDAMQAHFASQFRIAPRNCPQLGYPRLDCAVDGALRELAEKIDRTSGFALNPDGFREVYIYLPTYRDSGRDFFLQALPDMGRLSVALKARDALLYIKPHPRTKFDHKDEFHNIRSWPAGIDFNTYLAEFDCLITDYSSVLYDFLLHRSAVVLYTFDLDEYLSTDRDLVMPYEENVAGMRVSDFKGLCSAIHDGSAFDSQSDDDIAHLRTKFWGGSSLPASAAIVEHVMRTITHGTFSAVPVAGSDHPEVRCLRM